LKLVRPLAVTIPSRAGKNLKPYQGLKLTIPSTLPLPYQAPEKT